MLFLSPDNFVILSLHFNIEFEQDHKKWMKVDHTNYIPV